MVKSQKKFQAHALRRSGMSIKAIAEKLSISKSSASVWCRDVVLSKRQEEKLYQSMVKGGHKGRMLGAQANKKKREDEITFQNHRAQLLLGKLSSRDILLLGIGLYWGEGSKNTERKFVFTNSDPGAIHAMLMWLDGVGTSRKDIVVQIYINEQHKDRIVKVKKFWLKQLHLQKEQFRNPVFIKTQHKKIYANRETYFGICRLTTKNSAKLKYFTMGLLSETQKQVI